MGRLMAAGLGASAVVLLAAGCSGSAPAPDRTAAPSAPVSSPTPTPSPTAAGCPSGSYTITKLQGQGSASALGTGTGGTAMMSSTDGSWRLSSDGSQPIKLDVGPTTADLTLTGDITGGYTGDADSVAFTVSDASGSAVVRGFGISKRSTMRQVADQLVPTGTTGSASCAGDQATLSLPTVILTLTRR